MATLGNLVVNLSANSQRFSKGIGKAQQRLTKFVAGAKASMASVGGIVAKVGGAIGVGGLGFGIKLAADAESAQVAFATLLGSSELAKKALSDLQGFAASTPFELGDLRNASKLLLNAGVSTDELIGRMTMLGDIAAGTGKPINDFAQIYSKVKATGKVSLETLNQLAERGVPIYDALAKQLGVSREEMLKMISRGEVGFNDMHNSLAGMSEEGGTFAGGMKAQSTTLAGLFSTMKDNIGFALQAIAEQIIDTFDFKAIMERVIEFSQSITENVKSMAAPFEQAKQTFFGLGDVVGTVFSFISDAYTTVVDGLAVAITGAVGIATFAFENMGNMASLAGNTILLAFVTAFETMKHFFLEVLPVAAAWFWDNLGSLFSDGVNFAITTFTNMGTNIQNAWTALWDWINGDSDSFAFEWKGLTDGFVAETKKLPAIANREMTAFEKSLEADIAATGDKMDKSWDRHVTQPLDELARMQAMDKVVMPATPQAPEPPAGPSANPETETDSPWPVTVSSKMAGIAQRGSAQAFSQIITAMQGGQSPQEKLAKQGNKSLDTIAKNTDPKNSGQGQPVVQVAGAA